MTTLVYLYKRSPLDELRYSIRSACTNWDIDRIILVGDRPPRWSRKIVHIPGNRFGQRRQLNIFGNIHIAATHKYVPDEFVLMNDDFFVLTPDAPRLEHQGRTLADHFDGLGKVKQQAGYGQSLRVTREWLLAQGLADEPVTFEGHKPMPIAKAAMARVADKASRHVAPHPVQLRSAYGNLAGQPASVGRDRKIHTYTQGDDWKSWPTVSTNERSFTTCPVGDHIRAAFPDPSPFERTT